MNVLDKIVARKQQEVDFAKSMISTEELHFSVHFDATGISTVQSLRAVDGPGIISEFKRQSPSKGMINDLASVVSTTQGYENAGAAAISILTDRYFFGGSVEDLQRAKKYLTCPVLRKDFIIDEYQIYQTKAMGADLMLLIAAILTPKQVVDFTRIAHSVGLEVLLEIHSEDEFKSHYVETVDILGVNNRDLKYFKTTIENSIRISEILPKDQLKISESGISSIDDVYRLMDYDYEGFLIGEQFMKNVDPAAELKKFITKQTV